MKRRFLYALLFAAPAFLASVIISALLFGAVAGTLWLFVLGDARWPSSAEAVLAALFILVCVTLWGKFIGVAYRAGRKQEARAVLNPAHLVMSAVATAVLVLLVVFYQWSVGNIGAQSSGLLCAGFCRDRGFAGSGMPSRDSGATTCSCFDARGREAVRVPIADVTVQRRK